MCFSWKNKQLGTYFKLLEGQVSSGFVVAHVVVPSLRKLEELRFLRSLYVRELLLLRGSDVVLLPLRFLLQ